MSRRQLLIKMIGDSTNDEHLSAMGDVAYAAGNQALIEGLDVRTVALDIDDDEPVAERLTHSEDTLDRVVEAMMRAGITAQQADLVVNEILNSRIVFREGAES